MPTPLTTCLREAVKKYLPWTNRQTCRDRAHSKKVSIARSILIYILELETCPACFFGGIHANVIQVLEYNKSCNHGKRKSVIRRRGGKTEMHLAAYSQDARSA